MAPEDSLGFPSARSDSTAEGALREWSAQGPKVHTREPFGGHNSLISVMHGSALPPGQAAQEGAPCPPIDERRVDNPGHATAPPFRS